MKRINASFILLIIIYSLSSCFLFVDKDKILKKYKMPETDPMAINYSSDEKYNKLYKNNYINITNGLPFYIIRLEAPFYLTKPDGISLPNEYTILKYGDIVFPVNDARQDKFYFFVKTVDNRYGWIFSGCGISLNLNNDPNLYFFGEEYYLKFYKEANGNIDKSNKVILSKNIVPMLLGNFTTDGWFYPEDYELARQISEYTTTIIENKDTRFFAASIVHNWNYSEYMIAYNLLADCYVKLKMFDKAKEIHEYLVKKYFWQSYDNCPLIGGLNSIVKLEMIYLEELKREKIGSEKYKAIKEEIIKNILIVGDKYNDMPALDKRWPNLTFAEWLLDLLRRGVSRSEFYSFTNEIKLRTSSEGFADMVDVYIAVEKYREGKKEEALEFLRNYKPKNEYQSSVKINEWLSTNKIIPDSVIFQYK